MPTGDAKCRCHRKSASEAPSMNSVFKSMYILLLVVILVFHAALPLLSLNPKPAVKAAVPAQTQLPSTNDAFSYDALSFRLFISVGSLRLRRRPTWDLSRWDSTLGFPGEGPPTGKLGTSASR